MIKKLKMLVKSVVVFKNWPLYFLDRLKKDKFVILTTRNGIKYKIRKVSTDKGIILEIFFDKIYTPKGFEIKKNDIVIDIGGHVGIFSLYASLYTKNKIFSFEPIPENYNLLKENIKINKKTNIFAFNVAICNKRKNRYIFYDEENTGGHSLLRKTDKKFFVKCVTLEDIFEKLKIEKCDFLKIDCEGCEYEIISNISSKTLGKISKISMELHEIDNYSWVNIEKTLRKNGFIVLKKGDMIYAKRMKHK